MTVQAPPTPDYYRELEVDPSASTETIRAAYTALAKRHHPDLNPARAAAERMQRLNDAYAVLGGEKRRRAYDAVRAAQFSTPAATITPAQPASEPRLALHRPHLPRGLSGRTRAMLAAVIGASSALLLIALFALGSRLTAHGSAKAAPAATPASNIVRRQTSSGAAQTVTLVHAADVVLAAASYPGFPQLDALHDAAHGSTSASLGWSFQVLGCTVLAGEYDGGESVRAAIAYWRAQSRAEELDAGAVVVGISDCPTPAAQATVLAALRDILAHPNPTASPTPSG